MKTVATFALSMLGFVSSANAGTIRDVQTFAISKSQNKNEVQYAVHVDEACMPLGPNPAHAYWRMLERNANATEPLTEREERLLGIQEQKIEGHSVRIVVRGLPSRPVTIQTWKAQDGTCMSSAMTSIGGSFARLFNIHVVLKTFSVDYVLFTGWSNDGSVIRERVAL